jgi:hypothetical protein
MPPAILFLSVIQSGVMSTTSVSSDQDTILRAVRTAAERARRLGETVPLSQDEEVSDSAPWFDTRLLLLIVGGLGIWAMVLFLLGLN